MISRQNDVLPRAAVVWRSPRLPEVLRAARPAVPLEIRRALARDLEVLDSDFGPLRAPRESGGFAALVGQRCGLEWLLKSWLRRARLQDYRPHEMFYGRPRFEAEYLEDPLPPGYYDGPRWLYMRFDESSDVTVSLAIWSECFEPKEIYWIKRWYNREERLSNRLLVAWCDEQGAEMKRRLGRIRWEASRNFH